MDLEENVEGNDVKLQFCTFKKELIVRGLARMNRLKNSHWKLESRCTRRRIELRLPFTSKSLLNKEWHTK